MLSKLNEPEQENEINTEEDEKRQKEQEIKRALGLDTEEKEELQMRIEQEQKLLAAKSKAVIEQAKKEEEDKDGIFNRVSNNLKKKIKKPQSNKKMASAIGNLLKNDSLAERIERKASSQVVKPKNIFVYRQTFLTV